MNRKSKVLVKRLTALCVATGLAFSVTAGSEQIVSALSTPTFKWQTLTLPASSTIARGTVWSSNSTGVLNWQVSGGGCARSGENIATYAGGVCNVRVRYAASKLHTAIDSNRSLTVVPSVPVAPVTTAASAPGIQFPFKSKRCSNDCVLGDTGPGGGMVFYVASKMFTSSGSVCAANCKYLEFDFSRRPTTFEWCDKKFSLGLKDTEIGRGMDNTTRGAGKCSPGGALSRANAFTSNGKSDWFLPSRDELFALSNFMWLVMNADKKKTGNFRQSEALFKTYDLSVTDIYWSSSEYSQDKVYTQMMDSQPSFPRPKLPAGGWPLAKYVRAF